MMRDVGEFRTLCQGLVQQRIDEMTEKGVASGKRRNMVELLYEQRMSNPNESLTNDEIIDEYITFFAAGMDTTGHLVTMLSWHALTKPEHMKPLMDEVNTVFEDPSKVDLAALNTMEYMTAFIKETLRMTPPAVYGLERVVQTDHCLGGINVKKGTVLTGCFLANNFDHRFHNDPDVFDPQRWMKPSKTQETINSNPYVFTPFLVGGRNCIGQHLAQNEAKVLFSLFLKKFHFELADKDYKMRLTTRFLYEPLDDLKYRLTPIK